MRSGLVRRRARPLERTWARVFREAGGRVVENVYLRDMGVPGINCDDGRRLEVVATGLPLFGGVPLAVDATLISPLHADGTPWAGTVTEAGKSFQRAEDSKATSYPELQNSPLARLTTLACEVGGRWSEECCQVVAQLAHAKARAAPQHLRTAARCAYEARWWALLSCAQQSALAATLVDDAVVLLDGHDGAEPVIADVLVAHRV